MAGEHQHGTPPGASDGADQLGFDWWRALDLAVWAAVAVIAVLGIEWLVGTVVRERIAAGANRLLVKAAADRPSDG